ncbi:MAG: rod shape-determining protein RodA [Parcubacteria group bacterium]|nr:rod shape-determining protein RodA [Parcubacteria group bacterium]|tara:strand:+ start:1585 stop:2727 length:1143 start_codon:yes stop_codon:yes gene_type:complete
MGNLSRNILQRYFGHIDILLLGSAVLITLAGLVTMQAYGDANSFFEKQVIWLSISVAVFFVCSFIDFRFLRRTNIVTILFGITVLLLLLVFVFGDVVKGAQSRFNFGGFAVQPAEYAKLVIIALLAKYFTRRHIEIAHIRHILLSGVYALIIFLLILLQPDFGSAIMIAFVWFGMVLVSGISKKHLLAVFIGGTLAIAGMWMFVFADYQKDRILTFLNPLADVRGAGYNAYQSTIAVGSGQFLGKGIGYGTQSKLQFLPEYETDFIFASFAEEWGFVGVVFLFMLFGILLWRILMHATLGATNFETLFALGVAILFISHFTVHIGMNIGLLPVTGVTLPFMSYGGSHLLIEFAALGMIMGMSRYSRTVHRDDAQREFIGV